ncbi:DsbE family thiol:disulfide interchange protein [Phenylobacterium sp. LjRoot225]|uniref:DsbE family thiol:disulfide interchange protein n=1 Tax=Phenylobacterium sp. LjRoot225 TaxID=3342285 RepID=UPI003ECEEC7F
MSRWLSLAPLVVLAALAALFGLYALNHDPQVQPRALVGRPMPDLTLPALEDGQPVRLRELTAKGPVIVNFFASWCAPCEVEAPQLNALAAKGVRIVGIAYKDAPEKTQAFLARLGDPYVQRLTDRDGRAGVEFGTTGVPETYLVGRDGVILDKHTGPIEAADVEDLALRAR